MRRLTPLVLAFSVGCGGTENPTPASDGGVDATVDASTDVGKDSANEAAGSCATTATVEACITCCKSPQPPNYGGFELYASDACNACPLCSGLGPCGTNGSPPAGALCVKCLQAKITKDGLPSNCTSAPECAKFAACMMTCPAP